MIIDFRSRPPTRPFQQYFTRQRVSRQFQRHVGTDRLPACYEQSSLALWVEEMRAAGVTHAVITGRNIPGEGGAIPNDHIAEIVRQYPRELFGFGAVDPLNRLHNALAEIERIVRVLRLSGVYMDPGRGAEPLHYNDRRLYPLYARCLELGVPVYLMSAIHTGPDIGYTNPLYVDQVAGDFPDLKIVMGHGCWPYVMEVVAVAARRPNVFVSPDLFFYFPGAQAYVEAANSVLPEQILFATAFPYRPFDWSLQRFDRLGLTEAARERVLFKNAMALLGLS